ncbi:DgyrCDS5631 [Dimorphilus gyrociliatus]|uniref:Multidrug and toxin extrusion protein n=1 Tax=Dimorphilus gyrociliatus TaxID=2664684 RepID=A0A7I8VN66_9ANNE|nr:DgyrCDS5631 [Dimorphilus gyrociliatus]
MSELNRKQSFLFPNGYFKEFKEILLLSWPIIVTEILNILYSIVAVIFCGHLGKNELDGVALANSIINVFGMSVYTGLSSACDTLFSQIYGSSNKKLMGVVLQRNLIIFGMTAFLIMSFLVNGEAILLLLGQDPSVAQVSGDYLTFFLPGLFFYSIYICLYKYLSSQNKVIIIMIIGLICNAFNIGSHFLLVTKLQMSIRGSAISLSCSYCLMLITTLLCIRLSKLYKSTWSGFSLECFIGWSIFLKLAISGMIMLCIEWWSFELGIFLAGLLGKTDLAAQSVAFQIDLFIYRIPLGFGIATGIRTGQFLGNGSSDGAKTSTNVAFTIAGTIGLTNILIFNFGKHLLPQIFTSISQVINIVGVLLPIMSAYVVFDGFNSMSSAVLRGCGRQKIGAISIFSGYCVGLTIGISLMFKTSLRAQGFWIGLSVGLGICAIVNFIIVARTNWINETYLASIRTETNPEGKALLDEENKPQPYSEERSLEDEDINSNVSVSKLTIFKKLFTIIIIVWLIYKRGLIKFQHHCVVYELWSVKPNKHKRNMTASATTNIFRKAFPNGYWKEFKGINSLAWRIIFVQLSQMLVGPIAVIFCGRLGKIELDAVSLAVSVVNVTGFSLATGLGAACETLFSQIYGSKNKKFVGVVLQRSLVIMSCAAFICMTIHVNTGAILRAIGQDPEISHLTGIYVIILLPGIFAYFINICLSRYLMTQDKVLPVVIIGFISNGVNAGLHGLLVIYWDFSIKGSAVAQSCCFIVMCLLTLLYIIFSKFYEPTWDGFQKECLFEWSVFVKLAIPGMIMICVEWWSFEIGVFLAGVIGKTELGAQSVLFQLETVAYILPYGLEIAATIRIGQFLGSGDKDAARTSAHVTYTIMTTFSLILILIFSIGRYGLPKIFTDVEDVILMSATVMPALAAYLFFDGLNAVSCGMLRGCGRQSTGAFVIIIGYMGALAVGISLLFKTKLKLLGLWSGLAGGLTFCGITNFLLVIFTNWPRQVELAAKRTEDDREKESLLAHYSNKSYNDEIQSNVVEKRKRIYPKVIFIIFSLSVFIAGIVIQYFTDGFNFDVYSKINTTIDYNMTILNYSTPGTLLNIFP